MTARRFLYQTIPLTLLAFAATAAQAQWPTGPDGRPSLAPVLKDVTPAVVNISVTSRQQIRRDPFFDFFFGSPSPGQPQSRLQQSVGSGVIIDAQNGYVMTNHHVIQNAEEIIVTLTDMRRLQARVIGSDAMTDIALLQVESDDLVAIPFGDASRLEVGDFVVAIGNPFGLGQTVTSGIVSALGRSTLRMTADTYQDFIQTDASINPGNSGGPLVNLAGEVIGINTAIVSPGGGGNVGIGFAVPSYMAKDVMNQLIEFGEVRRGLLGVTGDDVSPDLAQALDLPVRSGAIITSVTPGSAAEAAGLRSGDVIVELNNRPINSFADLRNRIGVSPVGAELQITYIRDGSRHSARAVIGQAEAVAAAPGQRIERLRGAEFRAVDRSHPQYGRLQGVLVDSLEQGSPAANAGLRQGDVIVAVNRVAVRSVEELGRVLPEDPRATIALDIIRGNARMYLILR